MKLFKRKNHEILAGIAFYSCEDKDTLYIEFPDGLRLIFREGKYIGWYLTEDADG